ncbi:MAG: hypothetical protein M3Y85_00375 [Bacteroidota bacterium]|nr:hypothetical protein [Bacteroidota bacterium]
MRLAISYLLILFLFLSCQKELHFDSVPVAVDTVTTAQGYLGGAPNACTPVKLLGRYERGFAFDSSHHLNVTATLTHGGAYSIYTNTVNGIYFKYSGSFTSTGTRLINLNAYGTPADTGSFVFTVHFNSSVCSFALHVGAADNVAGGDYFPNTPGSWWRYVSFYSNIFYDSVLYNSLPLKQSFNNNIYSVYSYNSGKVTKLDTFWVRKQTGNYIEYVNKKFITLTGDYGRYNPSKEVIYLKDNAPIGSFWNTDTLTLDPPMVPSKRLFYEQFIIKQKNGSLSINGATYTNVITVELVYYIDKLDGLGFSRTIFVDNSFAKDIGLIKQEWLQTDHNLIIADYKIK